MQNDRQHTRFSKIFLLKTSLWVMVFLIAIIFIFWWWRYNTYHPSTDDAYISANIINIAPQVSGIVKKVYVQDNQIIEANQDLFQIDPAPFALEVASAQANYEVIKQKIASFADDIVSAKAIKSQREAELNLAIKNGNRILKLVALGQMSKADADRAQNKIDVSRAALNAADSNLQKTYTHLGAKGIQNAEIKKAIAQLEQAKLNLSHTDIKAPTKGKITNFTLRAGGVVKEGEILFTLVEYGKWWIVANFKETQIENIKIGQKAKIIIDMYPNKIFTGTVESISAGSGSAFSLLPPENATGNWVKVTQRIPVKIAINNLDKDLFLQVGASATVTIGTK